MTDNLKIVAPKDKTLVNTHQDHEVKYWTKKFGISKADLKKAVKKVGNKVSEVKKWVGKNK